MSRAYRSRVYYFPSWAKAVEAARLLAYVTERRQRVRWSRIRHQWLVAPLVFVLALVMGTTATARTMTPADRLVAQTNASRVLSGLKPLTVGASITRVAEAQAEAMAASQDLYHNPDLATEVTGWQLVGENVGYGPRVRDVHWAFLVSPGHRHNILDHRYTRIGVGVVIRDGRRWVAVVFKDPR